MTNPHAGDCRRATALVCHYGNQNLDGVNEILKEAVAVNRVTPLITSVLDLHESMGPLLHTQDGLACLTQMIYSLADKEDGDQDCRRAARLVIRHDRRDAPGINAVLKEAAEADRHRARRRIAQPVLKPHADAVLAARLTGTPTQHPRLGRTRGRRMTLRPCLICGQPAARPRCPEHTVDTKPTAHARGYDAAWQRLSKRARRLQPFCTDCGSTEDLQCDHTPMGTQVRQQDPPASGHRRGLR